jgi:peptidyl-prolyl cis-trans isomerase C
MRSSVAANWIEGGYMKKNVRGRVLKNFKLAAMMKSLTFPADRRLLCAALILAAAGLSACGDKSREAKPGQAIASVNGKEITVLQLNEELQRAGVVPAQQDAASKQLLQALIDRQLLQGEAVKEKLDRDPNVMQAIERAKAMIVAQAYLQKRVGSQAKPTAAEVEEYFNKHPEFFSRRKQFTLNELIIPSRDLTADVKAMVDGAKSLEQAALGLDANKVKFVRTQVARSTADLAPQVSAKLLAMAKGQLFLVREGERSMLISIAEVRDAPVTLEVASEQIAQFLASRKSKEATAAELARLRAGAKIEYLNKALAMDAKGVPAGAAALAPVRGASAASAQADPDARAAVERGVVGLK